MISEWAAAEGRDPARIGLGLQLWHAVDDDRDKARERLAARMEGFYQVPYERFERYAPYGRPEEIAEFLMPYLEAGCEYLNLVAVQPSQDEVVQAAVAVREALAKLVGG